MTRAPCYHCVGRRGTAKLNNQLNNSLIVDINTNIEKPPLQLQGGLCLEQG
ncbi:MAG: hypothetical protein JHD39_04820 [Synechococcus sp. SupBloom_Metag_053]|nr:hypothetical protein [Synechococcus sp. SupBloom_Metag_053]